MCGVAGAGPGPAGEERGPGAPGRAEIADWRGTCAVTALLPLGRCGARPWRSTASGAAASGAVRGAHGPGASPCLPAHRLLAVRGRIHLLRLLHVPFGHLDKEQLPVSTTRVSAGRRHAAQAVVARSRPSREPHPAWFSWGRQPATCHMRDGSKGLRQWRLAAAPCTHKRHTTCNTRSVLPIMAPVQQQREAPAALPARPCGRPCHSHVPAPAPCASLPRAAAAAADVAPPYRRFIGEWYEPEPPHHAPTEDQIAKAARSCFIVGGIYLGWMVLAIGCVCFHTARSKVR
jgi:hypothetical protein